MQPTSFDKNNRHTTHAVIYQAEKAASRVEPDQTVQSVGGQFRPIPAYSSEGTSPRCSRSPTTSPHRVRFRFTNTRARAAGRDRHRNRSAVVKFLCRLSYRRLPRNPQWLAAPTGGYRTRIPNGSRAVQAESADANRRITVHRAGNANEEVDGRHLRRPLGRVTSGAVNHPPDRGNRRGNAAVSGEDDVAVKFIAVRDVFRQNFKMSYTVVRVSYPQVT